MAKINLKNIIAFVEGTIREFLYNISPKLLRKHIREQIEERFYKGKKCLDNKSCLSCGCRTPGVFFATKGCSLGDLPYKVRKKLVGHTKVCYGPLLNKKEWLKVKQTSK